MKFVSFRFLLLGVVLLSFACSKGNDDDTQELESSSSSAGQELPVSSSSVAGSSSSVLVVNPDTLRWVGNPPVLITEVTPMNIGWTDHLGEDPGWVELYNYSDAPVNLKGYSLVEKLAEPRKWIFGDVLVPAKGFRTVFCSKLNLPVAPTGSETLGKNRPHTSYKLEKDGGALYLLDSTLAIRDSVRYPTVPAGVSWGMGNGGKWAYYDVPTPESANIGLAYAGIAPTVSFSQGGFYASAQTVNYPVVAGAVVRCTKDGSLPTAATPASEGTVRIAENTVLRCAAFQSGAIAGSVSTQTFFIGESVDLPVVSLAVDPRLMFNDTVGLYAFGPGGNYGLGCSEPCRNANFWKDDELRVHAEFYENDAKKTKAFSVEAGLQMMGQWSRYNQKKSVSITMREQYEDGRIGYAIFPEFSALTKFKAFNLRNNGNRFGFDYVTDAMAGSLLKGSGVDYMKSRQVVVFYNGAYYGIHDMREKLDEHYVEGNYGIDASVVDVVKHVGDAVTANGGTALAYEALLGYVASTDLTVAANYTALQGKMDVGNFADYMAAGIYFQNTDWPNNNVRAWRQNSPASPFKWMMFDVDHGFGFAWGAAAGSHNTSDFNMLDFIAGETGKPSYTASIFMKLLKNASFKALFINRSAVMLSHYFTAARVTAAIHAKYDEIPAAEMARDLGRFPYFGGGYDLLRSEYMTGEQARLLDFADSRASNVREHYRDYFNLGADAPMTLVASGAGAIRVHGMVLPAKTFAGSFFAGHKVELTAVPESGATFVGWSDGVTTATRLVDPAAASNLQANFK